MTLLLLASLIYFVLGGLTALEVRMVGFPSAFHMCFHSDGCPEPTMYTLRCPRRRVGRAPLTLFAWVVTSTCWPLLWAYGLLYAVVGVLFWVGERRI